jgi:hypothetical protein
VHDGAARAMQHSDIPVFILQFGWLLAFLTAITNFNVKNKHIAELIKNPVRF